MKKGLDSVKTKEIVDVVNLVDNNLSVENTKIEERINYSREEQLEKFGYITARDLTNEEIASLDKIDLLVSRDNVEFNGVSRVVYKCRAMFTNRLIVNVNFSNDRKKPKFMNDEIFNLFAGIFNLDTDRYKEFKIKVPVRLFSGISNNKIYYQYELIIAKSLSRTKVVRQFFNDDQVMLIEYNNELLSKFFNRKTTNEVSDSETIGSVDE